MRHDIDYAHEWAKQEARTHREWWFENMAIVACYVGAIVFGCVMFYSM
jgi:hypothetical protein